MSRLPHWCIATCFGCARTWLWRNLGLCVLMTRPFFRYIAAYAKIHPARGWGRSLRFGGVTPGIFFFIPFYPPLRPFVFFSLISRHLLIEGWIELGEWIHHSFHSYQPRYCNFSEPTSYFSIAPALWVLFVYFITPPIGHRREVPNIPDKQSLF